MLNQIKISLLSILFIFNLLGLKEAYAQFFHLDKYGKNRIQYKKFNWKYLTTPNFEIYYYEGGRELAEIAAKHAEKNFERITGLVGFAPYNRTKLLIYNSSKDIKQSNIGVNHQGYDVGGQTKFVRSEVEIAFSGTKAHFKDEVLLGITDILIFEMMYGGNLKETLRSAYLLNLPEWFMAGAGRYIAKGWSEDMDNLVRDLIVNTNIKYPRKLSGENAAIIGQSVWNYIVEEFGKANISSLLNLTRIVRNEELSIRNGLGIPYKKFIQGWRNYYLNLQEKISGQHSNLDFQPYLTFKDHHEIVSIKFSPDGTQLAYTININGKYHVYTKEVNTSSKEKHVFSGGYRLLSQKIDKKIPQIAWKNNNELLITSPKAGENYLWTIDTQNKSLKYKYFGINKLKLSVLENIHSIDVSSNGEQLIISGDKKGINNLYLLNLKNNRISQLTNDNYDALNPIFFNEDKDVLFSSNLTKDSLSQELQPGYDIFNIYKINLSTKQISQITKTLGRDIIPKPLNANEFLYLSDQRGIKHLYHFSIKDSISSQVTNYLTSIDNYAVSSKNTIALIAHNKLEKKLFLTDSIDVNQNVFSGKTPRQQLLDLRYLQLARKRKKERKEQEEEIISIGEEGTIEDNFKEVGDSLQVLTDSLKQTLGDVVNTDDYEFDTFDGNKRKDFLNKYKEKFDLNPFSTDGEEMKFDLPFDYESRFTTDNLITSFRVDPYRGTGLLMEIEMTDIFENHKINAGVFGLADFNNNNFYAEYEYLRHRFDYRLKFERHNLEVVSEPVTYRYYLNHLQPSVSYPFSISSRITVGSFLAFTRQTTIARTRLTEPDLKVDYGGFNIEFVFDNSQITGKNQKEGTSVKAKFEKYYSLKNSLQNFGSFIIDARHHQKIYRSLVFATKFNYGFFFGDAKNEFRLGGMNNWLFQEINDDPRAVSTRTGQAPEMSDLLFSRFITNMRGFNYNHWNGNNFMLFNAEIRLPLFQFLSNRTINSKFFRNFNLVGFTDIGSAWTGLSPFNEDNAINTIRIPDDGTSGGFVATVKNFKDPFLVGYGFGFRSYILGYYAKFDFAWGIEDKQRTDMKFYLTLGHDF